MITLILESTTGETVSATESGGWPESEYIWTAGNYRCDCNRHLLFWRWQEIEPDWETSCGEGAYRLSVITKSGTVYRD